MKRNEQKRKEMLEKMDDQIIEKEKIVKKIKKEKEIRKIVEKIVKIGKRGDMNERSKDIQDIREVRIVEKMLDKMDDSYEKRNGGYIRIMKDGLRDGENENMDVVELVERDVDEKGKDERDRVEDEDDDEEEEE